MPRTDRFLVATTLVIVLFGIFVRIYPFPGYVEIGFDEHVYRTYVNKLAEGVSYSELIQSYIVAQTREATAFLPPTRITFLSLATIGRTVTGQPPIDVLRGVSCLFGILTVFVAVGFAWRTGGLRTACGIAALMSAAPLQIYLCHRALIDGFFAFWALLCLWMLWETMQQPANRRWLIGYGVALGLLVLTKENAAFVYVGILGVIALNRWLKYGQTSSSLLAVTVIAPAFAVLLLIALAGGAETLFRAYLLNIEKSYVLDYAIKTGDGPWYRYLVDLFALSPLLMLLVCGALLQTRRDTKWQMFLLIFIVSTYVVMCNLRYGMNLRYGAIWDLPLRCFAFAQIAALAAKFSDRVQPYLLPALLALVAAVDFRQYFVLFVWGAIYDPVPQALLEAVNILK